MRWLVGIALLVIVVRRIGTERIADLVRWADQRLELFSPRGAGLYARFAVPLLESLYQRVADEVAALAPDTVLDVGTGPGALAIEIATRCGSCSVIGVDLAPEMLAIAEGRARGAGVADRVRFQVADAAALPLADASVDVAVSTLNLHHWRDPAAILRELHRVVRPRDQLSGTRHLRRAARGWMGGRALILPVQPSAAAQHGVHRTARRRAGGLALVVFVFVFSSSTPGRRSRTSLPEKPAPR